MGKFTPMNSKKKSHDRNMLEEKQLNEHPSLQGEMSSLPPFWEDVRRTGEGKSNIIAKVSKKKAAFTLAEVLITLGIIGVVAAMTIPNLISSYQKRVIETKLKEDYSIIQQVIRANTENDTDIDMVVSDGNTNMIKTFF
jgi:prepilin-type N-terminal cleavage/methylation domain-containing protein